MALLLNLSELDSIHQTETQKGQLVSHSYMNSYWIPHHTTLYYLDLLGIPQDFWQQRLSYFQKHFHYSNHAEISWDGLFVYFILRAWTGRDSNPHGL